MAPLSVLDIRARVARGAHPHILLRDLNSKASPRAFLHSLSQRDYLATTQWENKAEARPSIGYISAAVSIEVVRTHHVILLYH